MVQRDDTEGVRLKMLQDVGPLGILYLRELGHDTSVGNHDVEVVQCVLLIKMDDEAGRVLLDRSIILDDDEMGLGAFGEVGGALELGL